MISAKQIRAARALLDWTQRTLAEKAGLSITAINNIEREEVLARSSTLLHLEQTLVEAGIEFLNNSGVQQRQDIFEFKKIEGGNFIERITEDVLHCLTQSSEIVFVGANEEHIHKYISDGDARYQAHLRQYKIRERALVREGTTFFNSDPRHYRFLPKEAIGSLYWLVYFDRFVIFDGKAKHALFIRNSSIANAYMSQFNFLWKVARKPDEITIMKALRAKTRGT